ncbi:hypothetical protein K438DRAFT_1940486 [Mycena galopus ATCC 62051]|nr:hypothetical protein K438DRAFT_1940486 [Mycena galopus ATCC 62051]
MVCEARSLLAVESKGAGTTKGTDSDLIRRNEAVYGNPAERRGEQEAEVGRIGRSEEARVGRIRQSNRGAGRQRDGKEGRTYRLRAGSEMTSPEMTNVDDADPLNCARQFLGRWNANMCTNIG